MAFVQAERESPEEFLLLPPSRVRGSLQSLSALLFSLCLRIYLFLISTSPNCQSTKKRSVRSKVFFRIRSKIGTQETRESPEEFLLLLPLASARFSAISLCPSLLCLRIYLFLISTFLLKGPKSFLSNSFKNRHLRNAREPRRVPSSSSSSSS